MTRKCALPERACVSYYTKGVRNYLFCTFKEKRHNNKNTEVQSKFKKGESIKTAKTKRETTSADGCLSNRHFNFA